MSEDWVKDAAPGRRRKSKFFGRKSKPDGTNSKSGGTKSKLKPLNSFAELSLFKALHRPPTAFFLFEADSRSNAAAELGVACSPRGWSSGPFCLRFRFLRPFKQVKGWRRFMIADALSVICPTQRPRSRRARKGEPRSPRAKSPRTREKDRPIDPTSGKNSSAW